MKERRDGREWRTGAHGRAGYVDESGDNLLHAERRKHFDLPGIEFFDNASKRTLKYIYPDTKHEAAGWLLYQHPDGQWVTLRKATDDDIMRISEAVSKAHHQR